MREPKHFLALYKKLVALYPREFREQFCDSMAQTFNDLWNERAQNGKTRFVVWMFAETAIELLREHLLHITQGGYMQTLRAQLGLSALISFLVVLVFATMEFVNRQRFRSSGQEDFAFQVFGIMFILSLLFVLTLLFVFERVGSGNKTFRNGAFVFVGVIFLVGIGWAWSSLVLDQMSCFLGVPLCD